MAWHVRCKTCYSAFEAKAAALPAGTREHIVLKCPSCGESHLYRVDDVVKAMEATHNKKK